MLTGLTGTVFALAATNVTATSPQLNALQVQANGTFQFTFTNTPGAPFSVLATTNLTRPFNTWTPLTGLTEVSPGQFQFTDPQATNTPRRFYRVHSP
jgi:hypothetical protein